MMKNELIKLDFAPGIKASDINYNFDKIKDWQDKERLRIGGHGLIEGFEVLVDTNKLSVTLKEGRFVSVNGEEKTIDEMTFLMKEFDIKRIDTKVICPIDGVIKLTEAPFTYNGNCYLTYDPLDKKQKYPDKNLFYAECEKERVPILQILDNKLYIDAKAWAGREISLSYLNVKDRIDSIFLTKEGKVKYERSINSLSPSHSQMKDYGDDYLIATIYWEISDTLKAHVYCNHRTYRKVYVDKLNRLYLNGKLYEDQRFIFFEEPEKPIVNDLWYDKETNNLNIWKEENKLYGWHPINDHSTINVTDSYFFKPGENFPQDSQTFIFPENMFNLNFVPNQHSLLIIIDNAPLMSDQYEEIIKPNKEGKEYLAQGIGFKLKDPLDRPTYVEVLINHPVKSNPVRETFQRAAIFVAEGNVIYSNANEDKIFETKQPYTIGEDQLEVYIDGLRLVKGIDFVEMLDKKNIADDKDKMQKNIISKYFKVLKDINDKQVVAHRVSKYVWNYEQLHLLIKEFKEEIKHLKTKQELLEDKLINLVNNYDSLMESLKEKIELIDKSLPNFKNFISKDEKLTIDNLDTNIRKSLVSDATLKKRMKTTFVEALEGFEKTDFIQVFYSLNNEHRILIENMDYVLTDTYEGLKIDLQPTLVNPNASLFVNGIKMGG